jgi:hypothetical protein
MDRLFAVLPFMMSMACSAGGPGGPTDPSTTVGKEFTLRPGATATLTDAGFKVKLEQVTDDSRCPVDVTCVWAGDAVAVLRINPDRAGETKRLHINRGADRPGEAEQDAYVIRFVKLLPAPRNNQTIPSEDYRATFVVQRR